MEMYSSVNFLSSRRCSLYLDKHYPFQILRKVYNDSNTWCKINLILMWLFQLRGNLADGPIKKHKNNANVFHLNTNLLLRILIKSNTRFG